MTEGFQANADPLRSRPLITQGMLDDLWGLNLSYLELLGGLPACPRDAEGMLQGLPDREIHLLASLNLAQRRELAACPYSLFYLNLPLAGACAEAPVAPPLLMFQLSHVCAVSALVFAWHLARSRQVAARMLLGLSTRGCEYLNSLSASRLPSVATEQNILATRFAGHSQYWSDSIQSITNNSSRRLEITQLAGAQWLALGRA